MEIRPGAVREARLEAGLSLADVADGQLTRAAIHLIEAGRSRPSMPTLELIARQTGKPINFFLAGDGVRSAQNPAFAGAIAEAERLLALDDHKAVIALLQPLAERDTDLSTQAYMSLYLGQAHTRLHHPDPAQTLLRRARELLEGIGDQWLLVECLDWEGAALYLSEDPRALPTVQEALRRCRELRPVPAATEARILGHLANIQVAEHDWDQAIGTYETALEAAGSLRDLGRMARMHDGLQAAYSALGNNTQALSHAHKAKSLYELEKDRLHVARMENNLAVLLIKQNRLVEAAGHVESSLRQLEELGQEAGKANAVLTKAELEYRRGNLVAAEHSADEALELAGRLGETATTAEARQHLGEISARREQSAEADSHFAVAIELFTKLDLTERLAECRAAYAQVLEARGDTPAAMEQWKQVAIIGRPHLAPAERSLDRELRIGLAG